MLTDEQKNKLERLKPQIDIMLNIINRKAGILSIVSTLAAAFLAIATFNEILFEMTTFVRFLLVALLALIPINLWSDLLDLTLAEKNNRKIIEEIAGIDVGKTVKENRKKDGKFWCAVSYVNSYMPWISCVIFTTIVLIIIFLIL